MLSRSLLFWVLDFFDMRCALPHRRRVYFPVLALSLNRLFKLEYDFILAPLFPAVPMSRCCCCCAEAKAEASPPGLARPLARSTAPRPPPRAVAPKPLAAWKAPRGGSPRAASLLAAQNGPRRGRGLGMGPIGANLGDAQAPLPTKPRTARTALPPPKTRRPMPMR